MVKLVALYKHPENTEEFDRHYEEVHTPLTQKMPGLQKFEVTRMVGAPMGGGAPYYLEASMYFADKDALNRAMSSPEGKAASKDLVKFAGSLVSMMIGEVSQGT